MLKYNDTLKQVLDQLSLELTTIQIKLNNFNTSRNIESYKEDILRLVDSNVSLLASYYMESGIEDKKKLDWLLSKTFSTSDEKDIFQQQLKNLYYLDKNKLYNTSQYRTVSDEILKFRDILASVVFQSREDRVEEEDLLLRQKDLKRVKKYFSSDHSRVCVKNIDALRKIVESLNMSDTLKTDVLMMIFTNELEYYKTVLSKDKSNIDDDINNFLMVSGLSSILRASDNIYLTNATMEDDYKSVVSTIKKQHRLDSREAFEEFYNKWNKKNKE